ncbi:MAG: UDP-3-O-(3-hydroxymyristoyl)glucosamine N-acyltransferase [Nitrospirota bacterium]|nr:UDP-3-O-(3-hydroxymyristoyl)glucosamine N-acyltransferase [Nitrospirota bacterium]MDP3597765.1 UDP-3-O-(3-hydroxymyristoyl)glucosamine N-acyltransferase [Nitrospirota bacterium]
MATRPRTPVTLAQIHHVVGGELVGSPQASITSLASFEEAGPNDLTFVTGDRMLKVGGPTAAGMLLSHRRLAEISNPHIVVANPTLAFAQVAHAFFCPVAPPRGIDATVVRGLDTQIGPDASIWPGVTLGDRVQIGARVRLYPGVFVGDDTTIGDDTLLYPNVVVREGCTIGARVIIHSGTVIGSDGFGYVQDQGRHYKIPQLGGVTLEDDVELGANVAIDRSTIGQTVIKQGTKVDNLVQIAHNVTIGAHSILVSQVGIAGSTRVGHHVMIGGQAGVADHIVIGDHVMVAARAGVNRNLEPNQIVSGAPVMPHEVWVKAQAVIPRLPELRQAVRTLEEKMKQIEARGKVPRTSKPKPKKRTK